jgi:hypothetical protein
MLPAEIASVGLPASSALILFLAWPALVIGLLFPLMLVIKNFEMFLDCFPFPLQLCSERGGRIVFPGIQERRETSDA